MRWNVRHFCTILFRPRAICNYSVSGLTSFFTEASIWTWMDGSHGLRYGWEEGAFWRLLAGEGTKQSESTCICIPIPIYYIPTWSPLTTFILFIVYRLLRWSFSSGLIVLQSRRLLSCCLLSVVSTTHVNLFAVPVLQPILSHSSFFFRKHFIFYSPTDLLLEWCSPSFMLLVVNLGKYMSW